MVEVHSPCLEQFDYIWIFLTLRALMSSASAIIGLDYRNTAFSIAIGIFGVLVHGVHAGENYRSVLSSSAWTQQNAA